MLHFCMELFYCRPTGKLLNLSLIHISSHCQHFVVVYDMLPACPDEDSKPCFMPP